MIALDTNAVVRLLVDSTDAPEQSQRVRALVTDAERRGDRVFVGDIVLAELSWVLTRSLRLPRVDVVRAIKALLDTPLFSFEDSTAVEVALGRFVAGGPGLADQLVASSARRAGATALYTFDRQMMSIEGVRAP